jgi:hypothetical protein
MAKLKNKEDRMVSETIIKKGLLRLGLKVIKNDFEGSGSGSSSGDDKKKKKPNANVKHDFEKVFKNALKTYGKYLERSKHQLHPKAEPAAAASS